MNPTTFRTQLYIYRSEYCGVKTEEIRLNNLGVNFVYCQGLYWFSLRPCFNSEQLSSHVIKSNSWVSLWSKNILYLLFGVNDYYHYYSIRSFQINIKINCRQQLYAHCTRIITACCIFILLVLVQWIFAVHEQTIMDLFPWPLWCSPTYNRFSPGSIFIFYTRRSTARMDRFYQKSFSVEPTRV